MSGQAQINGPKFADLTTNTMRKQYTFQRVLLSAYDTQLVGKYSDKADTVMVEIDSSLKSFSIQLPDFMSSIGKQFFFKNLGANAVTLLTKNGQYLDYPGTFSKSVAAYSFYSVASNAFDKWLSLETNATLPPSAHDLDTHADWKPLDSVNMKGQMICCNSDGLWQKLSAGDVGKVLKVVAIDTPGWATDGSATKTISLAVVAADTDVSVADGTTGIPINSALNGMVLTLVNATVSTAGRTGTTDVNVRRSRAGTEVDMLSTATTVNSGAYYAEDGVPDTSNDDIATGDMLFIDVTAVSTTAPKGLSVTLVFE